jgi:hypothetical protein
MDDLIVHDHPTLTEPAEGTVYTVVQGRRFQIAEAEYWVDPDNRFTVRSREFDCFASGSTFDEALAEFGKAVLDYAEALETRMDEGTATPTEREALKLLSGRLSRIYLEERRVGRERKRRSRLRLRGRNNREWGTVIAS